MVFERLNNISGASCTLISCFRKYDPAQSLGKPKLLDQTRSVLRLKQPTEPPLQGNRNAGSTFPSLTSNPGAVRLVDGGISQKRIGDALGAVAGGVFREGTARPQLSRRGGA